MKVALLSILIVTLASCGAGKHKSAAQSQLGSSLTLGASFNVEEKNVALRICYAFRSKNTDFRASRLGDLFKFDLTETSCTGVSRAESISTNLSAPFVSRAMVFDGISGINYYSEVETDQHGKLAAICYSLSRGSTPEKSYLEAGLLVEVSFIDNSFIIRSAKKIGPDYIVSKEEFFEVATDSNGGGIVSSIKRSSSCPITGKSEFSQTLVP